MMSIKYQTLSTVNSLCQKLCSDKSKHHRICQQIRRRYKEFLAYHPPPRICKSASALPESILCHASAIPDTKLHTAAVTTPGEEILHTAAVTLTCAKTEVIVSSIHTEECVLTCQTVRYEHLVNPQISSVEKLKFQDMKIASHYESLDISEIVTTKADKLIKLDVPVSNLAMVIYSANISYNQAELSSRKQPITIEGDLSFSTSGLLSYISNHHLNLPLTRCAFFHLLSMTFIVQYKLDIWVTTQVKVFDPGIIPDIKMY